MEMPQSGFMEFDNFSFDFREGARDKPDQQQLQDLRQHIGMVFQNYHLWPHLTVLENVIEAPMRVKKSLKKKQYKLLKNS